MKEIDVKLWEIERKEIKNLPDKTKVLIFHQLYRDYSLISADKLALKLPRLSKFHKFFTLDEPNFNYSTKKS